MYTITSGRIDAPINADATIDVDFSMRVHHCEQFAHTGEIDNTVFLENGIWQISLSHPMPVRFCPYCGVELQSLQPINSAQ